VRVISGEFKGRVFNPPANLTVRPTTDRAKESLFNILNNHVDFTDLDALDLFAGTGNISYELISRGVPSVTLVERDPRCIVFIKSTLGKLGMADAHIVRSDVFRFIDSCTKKFNLIFADPPYSLDRIGEIPGLIMKNKLLKEEGLLVVEHGSNTDFKNEKGFYQRRNSGEVNFSIFKG